MEKPLTGVNKINICIFYEFKGINYTNLTLMIVANMFSYLFKKIKYVFSIVVFSHQTLTSDT